MKRHSLFSCSKKNPLQQKNYSLLRSNSFHPVANLATQGLKEEPNVIFFQKKKKTR
jgi:hypothetical protein